MKVSDYIYVTNVIPKEVCKNIVKKIDKQEWTKHQWYNPKSQNISSENTKELEVQSINHEMQQEMIKFLNKAYQEYNEKFTDTKNTKLSNLIHMFTFIRFNRYKKGTLMRKHYDHIHSIFDGQHKGIPVLSFVGCLNDDFKGGDFNICDKTLTLKTGDIIIFPSCFMFPHEVTEIKEGTRYSFISWGF